MSNPYRRPQTLSFACWGICLFSLLCAPTLFAQDIRGLLRDADNAQPIEGAILSLRTHATPNEEIAQTLTDPQGTFVFDQLRPGYYRCTYSSEGYESQTLAEILVAAGKTQTLYLTLRRTQVPLPELVIRPQDGTGRSIQPLSEIPLTRDQTLRFPATFFDPARLAMAYPGVANNDDQANGLIVRGNNPATLRWRLEGVDVVNPNHLPNAGTLSDRPAASAGGVLMFSAQLLDNSALLSGAYPAGYGDASGGIMDIRLRRGNAARHEKTIQAGLIGLDASAEGPLGQSGKNTYLANYRYSTVGLLGALGVSFGNEQITFQDLSFKTTFQGKKGGEWAFFGMGGLSRNRFTPQSDSADVQQYKDLFRIDFDARTGILGLSHQWPLGRNTRLRWAAVWSGQTNERSATGDGLLEDDQQNETRAGLSATLHHRLSVQNRLSAGVNIQQLAFNGESTTNTAIRYQGDATVQTWQPWANWEWNSRNARVYAQLGLHTQFAQRLYSNEQIAQSIEPRLSLTWHLDAKQRIALAYGYHSQLNPLWFLAEQMATGRGLVPAHSNQLMFRARHAGLKYARQIGNFWMFKTELFWQQLRDVPVEQIGASVVSLVNLLEPRNGLASSDVGKGDNKGVELGLERYFGQGWFMATNTTLFRATYEGADGTTRRSRWDLGHIANLTAGKEWNLSAKKTRLRRFGCNGRAVWAGGQRALPVDATESARQRTTVYKVSDGYGPRQADFFRVDLRLYWKRDLGNRRNSTFALDFQNATFRRNIAYQYYDPFTKQVETKAQLGFIPNLSWRLEF